MDKAKEYVLPIGLFKLLLTGLILWCFLLTTSTAYGQRKNFVIRTMDWAYKLVEGDSANPKKKYIFVIPILSYKPETRWQGGVNFSYFFKAGKLDSSTRTSYIRTNFSATQNKQYSIRPYFDMFTAKNRFNFRGTYQFTNFLEYYWGIGNQTETTQKELYSFRQHKANLKALGLVSSGLYMGVQLNLENTYNLAYSNSSIMKSSGIIGTTGYSEIGYGPVVSFDTRNHVYFPTAGHFIDVSAIFYRKELGSEHQFNSLNIDARKYIGLGGENVLAIQMFGHFNTKNVPFRMMGTIGNESYFRGYYFGRFRDLNAATLQAELRKTVWGPASIVAFAGIGNVSKKLEELATQIKPMFGMGLRVKAIPREKVSVRLDYAWGEKGLQAFYITLNEAF
jgi:outer membrane protein assembly factor BamA